MTKNTQQVLFSHNSDEWYTPVDFYNDLNNIYKFTLDPCSTDENAKCVKHYTIEENGLTKSWKNETVFVNPPYSNIKEWVAKSYKEWNDKTTIVLLVPSRTDTKWFHEYVYNMAQIVFIKGRLKFGGSKNSAPFPSMLVIYDKNKYGERENL